MQRKGTSLLLLQPPILLGSDPNEFKNKLKKYWVEEVQRKAKACYCCTPILLASDPNELTNTPVIHCLFRYQTYGQEERHCQESTIRRNTRLYIGHLLRQNWHTYNKSDVCL